MDGHFEDCTDQQETEGGETGIIQATVSDYDELLAGFFALQKRRRWERRLLIDALHEMDMCEREDENIKEVLCDESIQAGDRVRVYQKPEDRWDWLNDFVEGEVTQLLMNGHLVTGYKIKVFRYVLNEKSISIVDSVIIIPSNGSPSTGLFPYNFGVEKLFGPTDPDEFGKEGS